MRGPRRKKLFRNLAPDLGRGGQRRYGVEHFFGVMGESVTQLRKDIPVDIAVGIDKLFGVANVCGPIRPRDRTTLKPLEERDRYEGRNFGHGAVCLGGDPVKQPKIATYPENLKGNYAPLTADTHHNQLVTGRKDKSPSAAEYPYLEKRGFVIAESLGLQPAEYQAALWVGGKDITGVADARNMTSAMNQRIAKTAEVLDLPEQEVLVRFMNGDTKLYGIMLGLFGAEIAKEVSQNALIPDQGM